MTAVCIHPGLWLPHKGTALIISLWWLTEPEGTTWSCDRGESGWVLGKVSSPGCGWNRLPRAVVWTKLSHIRSEFWEVVCGAWSWTHESLPTWIVLWLCITHRPTVHVIPGRIGCAQWAGCVLRAVELLLEASVFPKIVDLHHVFLAAWAVPPSPSRNTMPLSSDFMLSLFLGSSLPLACFFFPLSLRAATFKKGSQMWRLSNWSMWNRAKSITPNIFAVQVYVGDIFLSCSGQLRCGQTMNFHGLYETFLWTRTVYCQKQSEVSSGPGI